MDRAEVGATQAITEDEGSLECSITADMKPSIEQRLARVEKRISTLEDRQAKFYSWFSLFKLVMGNPEFTEKEKLRRLGLLLGMLDREFPE